MNRTSDAAKSESGDPVNVKESTSKQQVERDRQTVRIEFGNGASIGGESVPLGDKDVVPALRDVDDPLAVARPDAPHEMPESMRNLAFESSSGFSFPREDLSEEVYAEVRNRPVDELPRLVPIDRAGELVDGSAPTRTLDN